MRAKGKTVHFGELRNINTSRNGVIPAYETQAVTDEEDEPEPGLYSFFGRCGLSSYRAFVGKQSGGNF